MSTINTLTEFLTQADTQFQLFDMGRQVRPLASDTFERIEQQQEPYPWPLQQHAWLGVHFFQPAESRHYLWFLKFALDERGLLIASGPKHFMDQVVETLGYKLTGDLDEEKAQRLAENPYTFRPAEAKMASLHAKLARQLEQAPSTYFEGLCHYLAAPTPEGWQTLGVQGFADLAERLQDERNLALVCKALPKLPQEPLYALCQSLENAFIDDAVHPDEILVSNPVQNKAIRCIQGQSIVTQLRLKRPDPHAEFCRGQLILQPVKALLP